MSDEPRSVASMAGVTDEGRLIHDFTRALTVSRSMFEIDETWRKYIAPVEGVISEQTLALAGRLYSLRVSTLRPDYDTLENSP